MIIFLLFTSIFSIYCAVSKCLSKASKNDLKTQKQLEMYEIKS